MANLKKLAAAARQQGLNPLLHESGHAAPLSRRDLNGRGFLTGTSYVLGPSALALMAGRAQAMDCGPSPGQVESPMNGMRILSVEAAGGMNIAGSNFMVWGPNGSGDFLSAKALGVLGVPAAQAVPAQVATDFGIPMHAQSSLREGMLAATTGECRDRINGFPICVASMDDSSANQFSLAYYAYKAGALGALSHLVGSDGSAHGARSLAPVESVLSSLSSTQIRTFEDCRNLVSATSLTAVLPGRAGDILRAMGSLSDTRIRQLTDRQLPAQIRDLLSCGYTKSAAALDGGLATAIDPSADTAMLAALAATATNPNARAFAVNRDPNNGQNQETLSLAYLLLKGYAGFATKVMGGRDYHNNPRAATNQLDFEVGFQIGQAFQMAHTLQKSLVQILYTDGGVGCSDPNAPDDANPLTPAGGQSMFTSDRGEGGAIIVLAYHPLGRPPLANPRQQVNAFNGNGAVDQNYANGKIVANSVTNAVQCALLNVLALHDRLGDADKVLGATHPFQDAALRDHYIMFGKWPA